jgi:hypothetical protein
MSELRPRQLLREIGKEYPNVWQNMKMFRAGKGKNLPGWPDWCYLPIAAGYAIVSQGSGVEEPHLYPTKFSPAVVTAAATWRVSQGVYRFDADLYNSLVSQPMDGNVPCEALLHMPEWCIYVETIGAHYFSNLIDGFWAHLESDANNGRMELRFVFFYANGALAQLPVHLGGWTVEEGLKRMNAVANKEAIKIGVRLDDPQLIPAVEVEITPFIQLVLYLCAENADMPKIQHPQVRVRMSGQVDIPREPRYWTVGERIGAAIREYRNQEGSLLEHAEILGTHASPRPHVRRAHWHHFWTGPREGERKLILRWLSPIPVGVDDDGEHPTVIHKVK